MSLTNLIERGYVTFYKRDNMFYLEFRPYIAYGIFVTDTFEGKTVKECYQKLMEKIFSKD